MHPKSCASFSFGVKQNEERETLTCLTEAATVVNHKSNVAWHCNMEPEHSDF